jgi:hypothetical protein
MTHAQEGFLVGCEDPRKQNTHRRVGRVRGLGQTCGSRAGPAVCDEALHWMDGFFMLVSAGKGCSLVYSPRAGAQALHMTCEWEPLLESKLWNLLA